MCVRLCLCTMFRYVCNVCTLKIYKRKWLLRHQIFGKIRTRSHKARRDQRVGAKSRRQTIENAYYRWKMCYKRASIRQLIRIFQQTPTKVEGGGGREWRKSKAFSSSQLSHFLGFPFFCSNGFGCCHRFRLITAELGTRA